jgi:hypothetical protein
MRYNMKSKVIDKGEKKVIQVEKGRAVELRYHLASHGISANPVGANSLEVDDDVTAEDIQTILDQWEA